MMVYVLCVYTSLHNIVVSSLDSTLLTMIERRLEYLMYDDICGNSRIQELPTTYYLRV